MLVASGPLAKFVHDHPSVKMLALAFLLLIGVTLVADGFGFHIDKAYIYAAMGFAVFVEALNLRSRRKRPTPVELRPTFVKDEAETDPARRGSPSGVQAARRPIAARSVSPTSGGTHSAACASRTAPGRRGSPSRRSRQAELARDVPDERRPSRHRTSGSRPRGRRGRPR